MTLRKAALVAGFGLLVMAFAAPFAEFYVLPKLFVTGDVKATVENIRAHEALFLAAIFCYLVTFIADVVVAWALYVLLAPVERSLSLLTAWFRLVYTAIALFALVKLGTVFRLLQSPSYLDESGAAQLYAHVDLLIRSFGYEWGLGFVFFGLYLVLLGSLVYRSGYIPRILGVLLVVSGVGYLVVCLRPYLYPNVDTGFVMITFIGELIFMAWLLFWGRRLEEPAVH